MKKYEIKATGQTLILTINLWEKHGKCRLYLNLTGSYGNFAYVENGVIVGTTKDWEKMERKCPEMAQQIKAAIAAYQEGE
ncbi:MAG TPA: hypothetical protein PLD70_12300 [Thermotogota bacterium]|nr:hypothetical protein [Thermotogota bacterium]